MGKTIINRNMSNSYVTDLRKLVGAGLLLLPAAAGAVFDSQDRLLVGKQLDGDVWDVIGGCIELDETPAEAVVREFAEETGLNVVARNLIGCFGGPEFRVAYENGDQAAFVVSLFACDLVDTTIAKSDGELSETAFIDFEELSGLDMRASGKALARAAFAWLRLR